MEAIYLTSQPAYFVFNLLSHSLLRNRDYLLVITMDFKLICPTDITEGTSPAQSEGSWWEKSQGESLGFAAVTRTSDPVGEGIGKGRPQEALQFPKIAFFSPW